MRTMLSLSLFQIARAAGWPNPGDRITRKEDVASGINWDAPGVYPAEVSLSLNQEDKIPLLSRSVDGRRWSQLARSPSTPFSSHTNRFRSGFIELPSRGGVQEATSLHQSIRTSSLAPARRIA